MTEPTTTLPTEPGFYLFCGFRDGPRTTYDARMPSKPEVVRVTKTNEGLMYVGSDFFYHPKEAMGVWISITAEAADLLARAQEIAVQHLATTQIPQAFKYTWSGCSDREHIRSHLIRFDSRAESVAVAERVIDAAITAGVIVPAVNPVGWWKLSQPPGETR